MSINNPWVPGDPFSYDLKWIVRKIKEHQIILYGLDERIQNAIIAALEDLDQLGPKYFESAADLISSDLKDKSIAYIEGFYSPADGGANLYYVTTDYNDIIGADFYLTLDGPNRWALPIIVTPYVTPEMFGAKGDGTTDDTLAVKTAFDMGKTVLIVNDYAVMPESDGAAVVEIDTPHTVTGGGSLKILPNGFDGYNIFYVTGENVTIENVTLIGDKDTHTGNTGEHGNLLAVYGKNVRVENVKCEKAWGDGIYVRSAEDVHIDGVTCDNNRRNAISVTSGSRIFIENSSFINTSGTAPEAGIAIEANYATDLIDCRVVNCIANGNAGTDGFYATVRADNSKVLFDHVSSDKAYSVAFLDGTKSRVEVNACSWHERDSRGAYIVRMENADNYPVFINNDVNASGSGTVIYQKGVGLYNLYIDGDTVRNGSFSRPSLWYGTKAGSGNHIDVKIRNCTFSAPDYPWLYTSDAASEYLHYDNDEVITAASPIGWDLVHDKIVIPADTSLTQDAIALRFSNLYNGSIVRISNQSAVRVSVQNSNTMYAATAASTTLSLFANSENIAEGQEGRVIIRRYPQV